MRLDPLSYPCAPVRVALRLLRERELAGLSRRFVRLLASSAALLWFTRSRLWFLRLLLGRILALLLLVDTVLLSHLSLHRVCQAR